METYKMKTAHTDYNKVAVIDEQTIYADKDGYFIWEHYPNMDGSYTAIPVRLGKSAKELTKSLCDYLDWNYRSWHGEMEALTKAEQEAMQLPDIK